MALRLVRQTSETPNITNKDDVILARYAYGSQRGVVKNAGREVGYTAENNVFKLLDGRIVIDGWEIDIDASGFEISLTNSSSPIYFTVYAEINVAIEAVNIKTQYSTSMSPTISDGDDLTQVPNGVARLPLYSFVHSSSGFSQITKKFSLIYGLADTVKQLEEGSIKVGFAANAEKVNNISFQKARTLLANGDIVSFKHKIASNISVPLIVQTSSYPEIRLNENLTMGDKIEVELLLEFAYAGNYGQVTIPMQVSGGCDYAGSTSQETVSKYLGLSATPKTLSFIHSDGYVTESHMFMLGGVAAVTDSIAQTSDKLVLSRFYDYDAYIESDRPLVKQAYVTAVYKIFE